MPIVELDDGQEPPTGVDTYEYSEADVNISEELFEYVKNFNGDILVFEQQTLDHALGHVPLKFRKKVFDFMCKCVSDACEKDGISMPQIIINQRSTYDTMPSTVKPALIGG